MTYRSCLQVRMERDSDCRRRRNEAVASGSSKDGGEGRSLFGRGAGKWPVPNFAKIILIFCEKKKKRVLHQARDGAQYHSSLITLSRAQK